MALAVVGRSREGLLCFLFLVSDTLGSACCISVLLLLLSSCPSC